MTITAAGVSMARVDVQPGQQVMFVNNDTVSHEPASNPHGTHTDCPVIGNVGLLAPGQSRATGSFTEVKACGFHDHLNPENQRMQGQIVVGNAQPVPGPGY